MGRKENGRNCSIVELWSHSKNETSADNGPPTPASTSVRILGSFYQVFLGPRYELGHLKDTYPQEENFSPKATKDFCVFNFIVNM